MMVSQGTRSKEEGNGRGNNNVRKDDWTQEDFPNNVEVLKCVANMNGIIIKMKNKKHQYERENKVRSKRGERKKERIVYRSGS